MSYGKLYGASGEGFVRIEAQSIDCDKVLSLVSDYEATHTTPITLSLSSIDWMWLGVAIDLLSDNPQLLRGEDTDTAHEQILNAMGSLMP